MKSTVRLLLLPLFFVAISCSSNSSADVDEEKPTITVNYDGGFPQPCVELVRGETYEFKAKVTDNVALASYSLDIHHNFDHHTHDDQGAQCEFDPVKEAVAPLTYMENFTIEGGPTSYEIIIPVIIPEDIDTGNYHTLLSVTDQTGWQSRTAVDIKIVE